jgi:hypothetical protein
VPEVRVRAVPDAQAMHEAMASAPVPKPAVVTVPNLRESTVRLAAVISRAWPAEAVGPLITWRLDVASGGSALVDMVHFGTDLGPAAEQMLARDLSDAAGEAVGIRDVVLPSEPMMATLDDGDRWLTRVTPVLDEVSRDEGLFACVGVPPAVAPNAIRSAVLAATARVADGRARVVPDTAWTLRVQTEACPAQVNLDAGDLLDASPGPPAALAVPDAAHD